MKSKYLSRKVPCRVAVDDRFDPLDRTESEDVHLRFLIQVIGLRLGDGPRVRIADLFALLVDAEPFIGRAHAFFRDHVKGDDR